MTSHRKIQYVCPRCSYSTDRKSNLSNHFKKREICKNENNVELTTDVKRIALETTHEKQDNIIEKSKASKRNTNPSNDTSPMVTPITPPLQGLNYNEAVECAMRIPPSVQYKLLSRRIEPKKTVHKHKQTLTESFDECFGGWIKKLDSATPSEHSNKIYYQLNENAVISCLCQVVSQSSHFDNDHKNQVLHLIALYESDTGFMNYYENDDWNKMLLPDFTTYLVHSFIPVFNAFEYYLVRELFGYASIESRPCVERLLRSLYQIYSRLTIEPAIKHKTNNQIMGAVDKEAIERFGLRMNDHFIHGECMKIYSEINNQTFWDERIFLKQQIINYVEQITKANTHFLNKRFISQLMSDQTFCDEVKNTNLKKNTLELSGNVFSDKANKRDIESVSISVLQHLAKKYHVFEDHDGYDDI